jgi:hypothetical protein
MCWAHSIHSRGRTIMASRSSVLIIMAEGGGGGGQVDR